MVDRPKGRPKTRSDDAKATTVCFTPTEKLAIHVISENRKARNEKRTTANEILVDALWHFLVSVEHKTREQIEVLLPPSAPRQIAAPSNLAQMPKPKKRS